MNEREPSPQAQLTAFLSRFPPGIVALAKRCLPKVRRTLPCSHELVYDYPNSVVVSYSMSERGYEGLVAVSIDARGIRLYFDKSLPDPNGRLEGSGGKVRSVAIQSMSDVAHADVQALFKAAIKHAGATFPRKRSTQMIIKSGSKKQKPKKAARA